MNLKNVAQFMVGACLLAIAWTSMGVPMASAQARAATPTVSMNLESVDVRDALKQLFSTNNLSYSIEPDIAGQVTLRLRGVPFETALRTICSQAGITYRSEGGVYQIVRTEGAVLATTPSADFAEPPMAGMPRLAPYVAITQDEHFLYVVRGFQVYKLDKSSLHVLGHATLPSPNHSDGFQGGLGPDDYRFAPRSSKD